MSRRGRKHHAMIDRGFEASKSRAGLVETCNVLMVSEDGELFLQAWPRELCYNLPNCSRCRKLSTPDAYSFKTRECALCCEATP